MYEHIIADWLEVIARNTERLAKAIENITEAAETQVTPAMVQQIIKHERLHEQAQNKIASAEESNPSLTGKYFGNDIQTWTKDDE